MSDSPFEHARRNEAQLNARQREVLDLLVAGKTNSEIGEALGITLDGAKWHVSEILTKLGLASREDAAAYWRWRRRPAGRLASLRGLLGMSALKWVAGGAAAIAGVGLLAGLFADDEPRPSSDLPPFYLEATMEIRDTSRAIGTNVAGGAAPEAEHRVAQIRWWQQDRDHMRVEIHTLEPASEAGTDAIVVGGSKQVYYRFQTNTYTETPLYEFPEEARLRTRPWSFSSFIGPWMTEVESLDEILEQLRQFGGQDSAPRSVSVVGRERLLGRAVDVVEYSPASTHSGSDGNPAGEGTVRYWIDPERLVVMKQVVEGGGGQAFTIEVTRLDWDTRVPQGRFTFQPPKDARRVDDDTASALADSGGSGSAVMGGSPGGIAVDVPAGMLRPAALPDGFRATRMETSHDSGNRPTSFLVEYEHPDGRRFVVEQRIRSGGPAQPLPGEEVTIGTRTASLSVDGSRVTISWAEGDLIVRITSATIARDELLAVVEALQLAP